jgi:hypothetical protein
MHLERRLAAARGLERRRTSGGPVHQIPTPTPPSSSTTAGPSPRYTAARRAQRCSFESISLCVVLRCQAQAVAHHPRRERRSWGPGPAATHLSAFSEVMGPLPVHVSEATPAGHYARSGRRDAANPRSSVSSRRLWGAHSSVVAESHDHAVDGTIETVALQ